MIFWCKLWTRHQRTKLKLFGIAKYAKIPKEKGPEWQHVIILDEGKNKQLSANKFKCISCNKIFSGGAACTKRNFLGEQGISKRSKGSHTVIGIPKKEDNERKELETKKQKLAASNNASALSSN